VCRQTLSVFAVNSRSGIDWPAERLQTRTADFGRICHPSDERMVYAFVLLHEGRRGAPAISPVGKSVSRSLTDLCSLLGL